MWRLLAGVAVVWTGLAFLWALQILPPAPTVALWFLTVLAKESGVLLAGFAALGIFLAATVALGSAALVLSLLPTAQAWRTARVEDAPLAPSEQTSGPAPAGRTQTATFAAPRGEELKLDVWQPPGAAGDARRRPAVVLVHGGGWHTGACGDEALWDAWLAGRGYVVLTRTTGCPRRPGGGTPRATWGARSSGSGGTPPATAWTRSG